MMESLLGTWTLLSFKVEDSEGKISYPYGKDVSGLLLFEQSGYMSETISGKGRPEIASFDINLMGDAEKLAITKDFIGAAGRFEVQGGKFLFHIDVSFIPGHAGTTREKFYSFEDDKLILKNPPVNLGEKSFVTTFVWKRVA